MSVEFKLEVENMKPEELSAVYRKALYKSMVKMKELAIRKCPVDLGHLRASIVLEPNITDSDSYTLRDGVEYGVSVEYGSSPHWVPLQPLIEWAKRHGGDEGFGYAIQRKIAKEGVNEQPFFRPALWEVQEIWMPAYFAMASLREKRGVGGV